MPTINQLVRKSRVKQITIMQAVNFFFVNALLFASLIAVVGVPVLYVTQPSTEEGQRESRRKIYSIAAVWVVLVFVTGIVSSLV
jgi:photosystem II PsbZ protein